MDKIASIILRYSILIILGLGNLWAIYQLFTFPTINFSFLSLKLFYPDAILNLNAITYSSKTLVLISSCVAGAAYFLLLLLNIGTPMHFKKRINSLLFLIISFFLINNIRIVFFGILFASNYTHIESLHSLTWHFLSVFLVIILWFINIYLFKIKEIPFYSDFKYLYSLTKIK